MKFRMSVLEDDSPCPINGKYFGLPMVQVPGNFLDWFQGQPHLMAKYPNVVAYIQHNQKAINKELEDDEEEDDRRFHRRNWTD